MMVVEQIQNAPIYSAIILLSFIVGTIYYFYLERKNDPYLKCIVFVIAGTFSVIASTLLCALFSLVFNDKMSGYRSIFSIFYTLFTFPVFGFLLQKIFKLKVDFDSYLKPIIVTIFIARIACLYQGCCNKYGLVYIEMAILLTVYILTLVIKKSNFFGFLLTYSIFRFISDFFKETFYYEQIGVLSMMQYMGFILICVCIVVIVTSKKIPNEEKL